MSYAWQLAATWRIAAELASSLRSSRVVQVGSAVPGDYAVAVVGDGLGQVAMLSVTTGMHVTAPRGEAIRTWADIGRDGPGGTVKKVLRGLDMTPERRPTTRRRRTYRIIAAVLEGQVASPHSWEVVMGSLILGAHAPGPATTAPSAQPGHAWAVFRERGLVGAESQEIWGLSRDGHGVAALHDGVAWFPGGRTMDLMRSSSTGEPRIASRLLESAQPASS